MNVSLTVMLIKSHKCFHGELFIFFGQTSLDEEHGQQAAWVHPLLQSHCSVGNHHFLSGMNSQVTERGGQNPAALCNYFLFLCILKKYEDDSFNYAVAYVLSMKLEL